MRSAARRAVLDHQRTWPSGGQCFTVTPGEPRASPYTSVWPWWEYAEMESPFGSPEHVAAGRPDWSLAGLQRRARSAAYECGAFPMPAQPGLMGWYSPLQRAIIPLDGLRVSHSLRKSIRRYEDPDRHCVRRRTGRLRRPAPAQRMDQPRHPPGLRRLFKRGVVHTVEAWTPSGELAGGLYGVSIGGLFAGESMFYRPGIGRDASKVALVALVELLRRAGVEDRLLDVQWQTPHLASLGAVELPREEYLRVLALPSAAAA